MQAVLHCRPSGVLRKSRVIGMFQCSTTRAPRTSAYKDAMVAPAVYPAAWLLALARAASNASAQSQFLSTVGASNASLRQVDSACINGLSSVFPPQAIPLNATDANSTTNARHCEAATKRHAYWIVQLRLAAYIVRTSTNTERDYRLLSHGCGWETFCIFAYCGLVVGIQIHLSAQICVFLLLPFRRQPRSRRSSIGRFAVCLPLDCLRVGKTEWQEWTPSQALLAVLHWFLWCILPMDVRTLTLCQLVGFPHETTKSWSLLAGLSRFRKGLPSTSYCRLRWTGTRPCKRQTWRPSHAVENQPQKVRDADPRPWPYFRF